MSLILFFSKSFEFLLILIQSLRGIFLLNILKIDEFLIQSLEATDLFFESKTLNKYKY